MAGRYVGAGITGYYEGRGMRRQSENADYDDERRRRLDAILDPINVELEQINVQGARRTNEVGAASHPGDLREVGYSDDESTRANELGRAAHPGNLKRVEYGDNAAQRGEEFDAAAHPGRIRGIGYGDAQATRNDEFAEAAHPYNMKGIEQAGNQAARHEQYSAAAHPGNMRGIEQKDTLTNQAFDQNQYFEAARRALANFQMTKNPRILEDFYNQYYPDGNKVQITADPQNPGGFIVTGSNGMVEKAGSADELYQDSLNTFMDQKLLSQVLGESGGGSRRGIGGYGYGAAGGGAMPARVQTVEYYMANLRNVEGYEHLSAGQLWMVANQMASQKAGESPEETIRNFYADSVKMLMPKSQFGTPRPEDVAKAQEAARHMTEIFADMIEGGSMPGAGTGIPVPGQGGQGGAGAGVDRGGVSTDLGGGAAPPPATEEESAAPAAGFESSEDYINRVLNEKLGG